MAKILVSACLIGCECRYSGDGMENEEICALAAEHTLIPVCPEQLGGLPTPRAPSEIVGGRVINSEGRDVTEQYRRGAQTALHIAEVSGADFAILKANSPSCGRGQIYDGSFSGRKIPGNGITAAYLCENGIEVYTEKELDAVKAGLAAKN